MNLADHPHLDPLVTPRGFTHLPPVESTYGGEVLTKVHAYESSTASGPHVWLTVRYPARFDPAQPEVEAVAHLTTDDAWHLAEQLITLVLGHYQFGCDAVGGSGETSSTLPADRAYDVRPRRRVEENR